MAILDYLGTQLQSGASTQTYTTGLANYIVESSTSGGKEIDFEDVFDANGLRATRLIFNRYPIINFVLIATTGATNPAADFPYGNMCTLTGMTSLYVESCEIATNKGATRVTVTLKNLGIT